MQTKLSIQEKPIIEIIDTVFRASKNSKLSIPKIRTKASDGLENLAKYLDVSTEAAILFSVIITENMRNKFVNLEVIADHLNLDGLLVLSYLPYIDELVKKRYLKFNRHELEEVTKRAHDIHSHVYTSVTKNQSIKIELPTIKNDTDLISYVIDLFDKGGHENVEKQEIVDIYLKEFSEVNLVQKLRLFNINVFETLLIIFCIHRKIKNADTTDLSETIEEIATDSYQKFYYQKKALKQELKCQEVGFLQSAKGSFQSYEVELTNKLESHLDEGLQCLLKKKQNNKEFKLATTITKMPLFYNQSIEPKIAEIHSLLDNQNYQNIKARMLENNVRSGFTILFYGDPGTGKTETVYQLARETGRDIMQVDASTIKSCWYGESQKNMKALFSSFNNATEHAELKPILFFNEADALFSKRIDVSASIDQTANALQNILLEELENFTGILIATTNLTNNLDAAFERRFLYKLKFEKPNKQVQASIWKSKFDGLSDLECKHLGDRYELTGSMIENISRKQFVQNILYGTALSLGSIENIIKEEQGMKGNKEKVGFKK